LLIVVIVLVGKLVLQQFAFVDNPISGWNDFLKPLIMPQQSSVRFVWYVYVLFFLYALLPIVFFLTRGNLLLSVIAAVPLHFWAPTSLFAVDLLCRFAVFFLLGGLTVKYWSQFQKTIARYGFALFVTFLALLALYPTYSTNMLIMGGLSIPALFWLISGKKTFLLDFLAYLGRHVYVIYLFSMIFVGVSKAVVFGTFGLGYKEYEILVPVFVVIGLVGPILLKLFVFRRAPLLDRITD
jgi:hypothetical protein